MIPYRTPQILHRLVQASVYLLCLVAFLAISKSAYAAMCQPNYNPLRVAGQPITVSFDLSGVTGTKQVCTPDGGINTNRGNEPCYIIRACDVGMSGSAGCLSNAPYDLGTQQINGNNIIATATPGTDIRFWLEGHSDRANPRMCQAQEWEIVSSLGGEVVCPNFQVVGIREGKEIGNYTFNDNLRLKVDARGTANWTNGFYSLMITGENNKMVQSLESFKAENGKLNYTGYNHVIDFELGKIGAGNYNVVVSDLNLFNYEYCKVPFKVSEDGNNTVDPNQNLVKYKVCDQIPPTDPESKAACLECQNRFGANGIWTAVGCVRTNATSIVRHFIQIGLGIAGGVALLMIIAAGFLLTTSQNDPKKVTEARELVTSAVIGLLFIVFSVTILQFIGVTILRIPGFGGQ